MEIDPAMPKDAGYYQCQSDNKLSIDNRGFIAKYELNQIFGNFMMRSGFSFLITNFTVTLDEANK